jgi:flagellar basal-body rod protein FlgG
MLNGLYKAAAGMKVRLAAQDVIANNLANAGTAGFQREIAFVQSRWLTAQSAAHALPPVTSLTTPGRESVVPSPGRPPLELLTTRSATDSQTGVLHQTGVARDLALDGPGFLVVETPGGHRLTRGGPLQANRQGALATAGGNPLLGVDGRPLLVADMPWQIAQDGTVTAGGAPVGRLRIVLPPGPLRHEGSTLIAGGAVREAPPGSVRTLQGVLERSNVEPVREMVDMIAGFRAYETAQRAVVAQDETLQQLFEVVRKA